MKSWRMVYLPGKSKRELEFTGDEAGLDDFFYDYCLCQHCKDEVDTGIQHRLDASGVLTHSTEPREISPFATGCGAEWMLIELTD